jgi:hypothetical protein
LALARAAAGSPSLLPCTSVSRLAALPAPAAHLDGDNSRGLVALGEAEQQVAAVEQQGRHQKVHRAAATSRGGAPTVNSAQTAHAESLGQTPRSATRRINMHPFLAVPITKDKRFGQDLVTCRQAASRAGIANMCV